MSQIETRPAKLLDIPAIVELAVESVSKDPLPVTISRPAMRETLQAIVGKAMHFCWVASLDGRVVAAVAAMSSFGFWFERQQCSVLLYYTKEPGAGLPLIREFARWVKSRPVIKVAVFELEPSVDDRLLAALKRMGFTRASTNLSYVRNA